MMPSDTPDFSREASNYETWTFWTIVRPAVVVVVATANLVKITAAQA